MQLYENLAQKESMSDQIRQLEAKLKKQQERTGELETTIQTERRSHFSTLQLERAEQEQQFGEVVSVLDQVLDRQEELEKQTWWQKLPIKFIFSPSVTLKANKKEVVQEREHHFYPSSAAHEHLFPEVITERYTPGKDKSEVFIR